MKGVLALCSAFGLVCCSVSFAATWTQQGMPGDLPATAQVTVGLGSLDSIIGTLPSSFTSVHMYAIQIVDFSKFSATAATPGTSTDFDTMMMLFDSAGLGVYFNDDSKPNLEDIRSTLPAGNANGPKANGLFYLAITGFGRFPQSSGGAIFPMPVNGEDVLGPTGPGGGSKTTSWQGDDLSIDGPYRIDLTGASFAQTPESASLPLMVLGIGGLVGWSMSRGSARRDT
jgi:hypothetical protein